MSKFIKDVEDLKNKKINIIDACIGFVKQNNSINKIVFGVENINQLKEVHESFHNYRLNIDLKYDYHDKNSLNPKIGKMKFIAIIQARLDSKRYP